MAEKLQILSGPAAKAALHDEVTVFRYAVNPAGLGLFVGAALLSFAIAAAAAYFTDFDSTLWNIAAAIFAAAGLTATTYAAYWHEFAAKNVIALDDERLLVGRPDRALWAVDWSLLDVEAIGLQRMQMTRMRGKLDVRVPGREIGVHLFNMIAYLEDIQEFVGAVLPRVVGEISEEE